MEQIKKNLLSVLLSKIGGVPLKNVERDYKSLVGEPIRWRDFGFRSLEMFLNSIPDVVRITEKKNELVAFGVASNNMTYLNATAKKAQFKESTAAPQKDATSSGLNLGQMATQGGTNGLNSNSMTVYIGGLPQNVTVMELKSFLNSYPIAVEQIRIIIQKNGPKCAFLDVSRELGEQICLELNGKRLGQHRLRIEESVKSRASKVQPNNSQKVDLLPSLPQSSGSDTHEQSHKFTSRGDASRSEIAETSSGNIVKQEAFRKEALLKVAVDASGDARLQQSGSDMFRRMPALVSAQQKGFLQGSEQANPLMPDLTNTSMSNLPSQNSDSYNHSVLNTRDSIFQPVCDEIPPLINADDWEEFQERRAISSSSSHSLHEIPDTKADYTDLPPLINRSKQEESPGRRGNPASLSRGRGRLSDLRKVGKKQPCMETQIVTFNLYVKFPPETKANELLCLFWNNGAIKIVPLSNSTCFVIFSTLSEVEAAARKTYMIGGQKLYVDVADRHKNAAIQNPDSMMKYNEGRFEDESAVFLEDELHGFVPSSEKLTCTIGKNNERKVRLSTDNSIAQTNQKDDFQSPRSNHSFNTSTSSLVKDIPPLMSISDLNYSLQNCQIFNQKEIQPPLASQELVQSSWKPPQQTVQNNSFNLQRNFQQSGKMSNHHNEQYQFDPSLKSPRNFQPVKNSDPLKIHENFSADKKVQSLQYRDVGCLPGSFQTYNRGDSQCDAAKPTGNFQFERHASNFEQKPDIPSYQNDFQLCDLMSSVSKPLMNNSPVFQGQPNNEKARNSGSNSEDHPQPCSQTSVRLADAANGLVASCPPSSPKLIPDEMRLKQLQRILSDAFPSKSLPTSAMMPDTVNVLITCIVEGFDNSFFWGQVASEPWNFDLQEALQLGQKIEEISGSLLPASTTSRRGTAKCFDEWCRVWIKSRDDQQKTSTVFYVDYGNFETLSNDCIYDLPEKFWIVRPVALPFKNLDAVKVNLAEKVNGFISAKVNKNSQKGCVFEIYDIEA